MTKIDLPPAWAPIPHDLICDCRVSDAAVRIYALLHRLGWDRVEVLGIDHLADLWPTPEGGSPPTRRSIYRWLAQLEDAGWLSFTRKPGQKGLGDRLRLHPEPLTPDSPPPPWPPKPVTPESQPPVHTVKPVTPESQVGQTCDSGVTACDSGVTGLTNLPHQDAEKTAPQILRKILRDSDPPPPQTQRTKTAAIGGGGGEQSSSESALPSPPLPTPAAQPETLQILTDLGISASARRELAHIAPAVVRDLVAELEANSSVRSVARTLVAELRAYAQEEPDGQRPVGSRRRRAAPAQQQSAAGRLAPADDADADADADLTPEQMADIAAAARAKYDRHLATRC